MTTFKYLGGHAIFMRQAILLLMLLPLATAQVQTNLYQGSQNCELVPEKEVLVLTSVYAETDGQLLYNFQVDVPGAIPYEQMVEQAYGQHKIFVYPEVPEALIWVNGERADGNPEHENQAYEYWTSTYAGAGRHEELVRSGLNDFSIELRNAPFPPVKGELVLEVAATSCSDEAWERAGTPLYGVVSSDCVFGVAQTVPGPDGDVYLCNPVPEAVEVPEMNEVVLASTAVAGSAAALWWYFRRKRPDAK
jgi:hypothetical protein